MPKIQVFMQKYNTSEMKHKKLCNCNKNGYFDTNTMEYQRFILFVSQKNELKCINVDILYNIYLCIFQLRLLKSKYF